MSTCAKCYDNNGRTVSDLQVTTLQARSTVTQCMPCDTGPNSTNTNFPLFIAHSLFVNRHVNALAGARERFDLPYNSISDAMVDAVSGDTIYVYPGNTTSTVIDPYIENITLKAGVSLYGYSAPVNGRGILDVALPRPVSVLGKLILTNATDFIGQTCYVSGFLFVGPDDGEPVVEIQNGASMVLTMSDCTLTSTNAPAFLQDVDGGNMVAIFNHCQFQSIDNNDDPMVTFESTSVNGSLSAEFFSCSLEGSFNIQQQPGANKGLSLTNTQVGFQGDSILDCRSFILKDCTVRRRGSGPPSRLLITVSNQSGEYSISDTYMNNVSFIDTSVDAVLVMSGNTLELESFEMNSTTTAQTQNSRTLILRTSIYARDGIRIGNQGNPTAAQLIIENSSLRAETDGIEMSIAAPTPRSAVISNSTLESAAEMTFETASTDDFFEFTNCKLIKIDQATPILLGAPLGSTDNYVFAACVLNVPIISPTCIESLAGNLFQIVSGGNNSRNPAGTGMITVSVPLGSLW